MNEIKQFLKDYLTYNKRERRGIFSLLLIVGCLLLYLFFSDLFFTQKKIDFSAFEKEVVAFEAALKKAEDSASALRKNYFFSGNTPISDYEEEEEKQNVQVKKPYYLKNNNKIQKASYKKILVELNTADTTELKKIKGIGTVFAKRIVKYRELLGGFVNKEQLLEVYGFDQEKYNLISPQTTIDSSLAKRLNINTFPAEMLQKHPYIDKKTAQKIVTHRTNNGHFVAVSQLLSFNITDKELYAKIAPYLTIQKTKE